MNLNRIEISPIIYKIGRVKALPFLIAIIKKWQVIFQSAIIKIRLNLKLA